MPEPWQVKAIRYLALAAALVVLLVPHADATRNGFIKMVGLEALTGFMLALYLPLAAARRAYRPDWRQPLIIGATVFLAALAATVPFSVDPYHSFWSDVYRQGGLFNYAHYWIWFMVLAATQRGWPAWRGILRAWNGTALAVTAYGLYDLLMSGLGARMESTFGNALYLNLYLYLSVLVALTLAARAARPDVRWAYLGGAGLMVLGVVMTGSRSGILGLLIMGVVAAAGHLAAAWRTGPARRLPAWPLIVLAAAALGVAGWLTLRSPSAAGLAQSLPAPVRRLVFAELSPIDRAVLADTSLRMVAARPLAGWGLDMYEHAFERFFDPRGLTGLLEESWYDRGHNQFLDLLATTGLVGFLGYLGLWFTVILAAIEKARGRDETGRRAAIALLAGLIGYAAILFYVFEILAVTGLFWLLLAYLASRDDQPSEPPRANGAGRGELIGTVAGFAAVLLIQALWIWRPVAQTYAVNWACRYSATKPPEAMAVAEAALAVETYASPELRFRLMDCTAYAIEKARRVEDRAAWSSLLAALSARGAESKPYDYKTRMIKAFSLVQAGKFDPPLLDRAYAVLNEARALQPNRYRTELVAAEADQAKDDPMAAAASLQRALDLCTHRPTCAQLRVWQARELATGGDYGGAAQAIRLMYEFDRSSVPDESAAAALAKAMPVGAALTDSMVAFYHLTAEALPGPATMTARYRAFAKAANLPPSELETARSELQTAYPEVAEQIIEPQP
jgi:O-antigen ligase